MMRKINVKTIRKTVEELCHKANFDLRKDVYAALRRSLKSETNRRAKNILASILENAELAHKKKLAICQDTGMVFVSVEIGQDVSFVGGDIKSAINAGVMDAYAKGSLRKSIVDDPFLRKNTGTNIPAIISMDIVPGRKVRIAVSPKGFGSENKSKIRMFNPTASYDDIKAFIVDTVKAAGPDACPPYILGIGIGGTFDKAALLAKKALLRAIDKRSPKSHVGKLERELVSEINTLGIGPMGLGGKTTVLGVNIETFPTHIAGLPVAVNMSCHATRSAEKTI